MRYRYSHLVLCIIFILSFFSPALARSPSPESKVNDLLALIYSLPKTPKLEPVIIRIDKKEKQDHAYYERRPKKLFGLKRSKTAEIHISERILKNFSDEAILVLLAHELGHHFDTKPRLDIEANPKTPLELLLREYEKKEEDQYFADAFALYILGEEIYKKGHFDFAIESIKENNGLYWPAIEKSPFLMKYYRDQAELWVAYSLAGAKSRLDDIANWIDLAEYF